MNTDTIYNSLLAEILSHGDLLSTRNHECYSHINLGEVTFDKFPLITVRRTAWKKAIREMEWFLSGSSKCPDDLKDWWEGQLNESGSYINGYSNQFRHSSYYDGEKISGFDQIQFLKHALMHNPNSRRLLLTSWNPGEMANITETNRNPDTPTTCHTTIAQFFVRDGKLNIKSYQRSADMLLGVPHNWVQSWAMLLWFAYNAGLKPGKLIWVFGDAHIYNEETHIKAVNEILGANSVIEGDSMVDLVHKPTSSEFKADDFELIGELREPLTKIRPTLL